MKKVILVVFTILSISSLAAETYKAGEFPSLKVQKERELLYKTFKKKANVKWVNENFGTKVDLYRVKDDLEKNIAELRNEVISDDIFEYVDDNFGYVNDELDKIEEGIDGNRESILNNTDSIKANATDINKNKQAIEKNKEDIDVNGGLIRDNFGLIAKNKVSIKANETAIENNKEANQAKISNLEHGISMIAAMDAANLSAVNKGDLEIAGGVATYAGKQAIAFGVAYAPINGLSLNLKSGFNFGKTNFWAASAGAKYKFNLSK